MEPDLQQYFAVHKLNAQGFDLANDLAERFQDLAEFITRHGEHGRQWSVALTKLEEACFFAKKSIAQKTENQIQ